MRGELRVRLDPMCALLQLEAARGAVKGEAALGEGAVGRHKEARGTGPNCPTGGVGKKREARLIKHWHCYRAIW